ncbi:CehA/McbA family metallohydrolase [Myxococcota bacterium]|nr:CehA/McbA family metallohydrolase [Myxococcota bacterium]
MTAALPLLLACASAPPPQDAEAPPRDLHDTLLADLAAPRHPSDGAGRLRLISGPEEVVAGGRGAWVFTVEIGALGVAKDGFIAFQAPPFWGWSPPQVTAPDAPGYTTVTGPEGVELRLSHPEPTLLFIHPSRALRAGELLRVHYGAGSAQAQVDRYADETDALRVAIDGDGDGVRRLLDEELPLRVVGGDPAGMRVVTPSTARPGEAASLRLALVDVSGNPARGPLLVGLRADPALGLPTTVTLPESGALRVPFTPRAEGVYAVQAVVEGRAVATGEPIVVRPGAPRLVWADLQVHTGLSDGTGDPAAVIRYARDVAGLDVVAITDHDHWGLRALDQHPALYQRVLDAVAAAEGVLALAGFEWTSWRYGHRHVVFFGAPGALRSCLDPRTDTPTELWASLSGERAITVPHHTAGGPVVTDWSFTPDPRLEPSVELVSVHGSSEGPDTPGRIQGYTPGHSVLDALAKGYRLGFLGGSDGHDGHPGLAQLAAGQGGLTGIWLDGAIDGPPTADEVYAAILERRTFATNGARIALRVALGGAGMGQVVPPGDHDLAVRVVSGAAGVKVELVRDGVVSPLGERPEGMALVETRLTGLKAGERLYVRVIDAEGGAAWSSPWFVE